MVSKSGLKNNKFNSVCFIYMIFLQRKNIGIKSKSVISRHSDREWVTGKNLVMLQWFSILTGHMCQNSQNCTFERVNVQRIN